ncbi:putative pyoverdine sidechain peptide synthetase domain protein [Pseudomonas putida S610]|nr:putative pyoverdine sidechain peptide synthetase domain protein [Pseudomonas putida S610]
MAVAGALGLAGGTGGIDHVSQVLRRQLDMRVRYVDRVRLRSQQLKRRQPFGHRQAQAWGMQQQGHAAVLNHVGQTFLGVVRVQRQVRTAGLEDSQQADDQLQRALGGDAYQHVRANAAIDQLQGQAIGGVVELAIGELTCAEHHGGRLGAALGLLLDQAVDAVLIGVTLSGLVPGAQAVLLAGSEHRQLAYGLCRAGNHAAQQGLPVTGHTLNGGGIEQVGGVHQSDGNALRRFQGFKGQLELRAAAVEQQFAGLQARQAGGGRGGANRTKVVEHHLEQRVVIQRTLGVEHFHQAVEGQVLVGLGRQRHLLDRLQPMAGRLLRLGAQAHDQGIDEEAHHRLQLLAVAVVHRHPDTQVQLAAVALQQQGEATQEQLEQGDALGLSQLAYLTLQVLRQAQVKTPATVAELRRARVIGRQRQHHRFTTQAFDPIGLLALHLALGQPLALPVGIVGVLHHQRLQGGRMAGIEGAVEVDELMDQQAHGPAI